MSASQTKRIKDSKPGTLVPGLEFTILCGVWEGKMMRKMRRENECEPD